MLTDIGQEYTVGQDLEEMLARVARGELNAAEAET